MKFKPLKVAKSKTRYILLPFLSLVVTIATMCTLGSENYFNLPETLFNILKFCINLPSLIIAIYSLIIIRSWTRKSNMIVIDKDILRIDYTYIPIKQVQHLYCDIRENKKYLVCIYRTDEYTIENNAAEIPVSKLTSKWQNSELLLDTLIDKIEEAGGYVRSVKEEYDHAPATFYCQNIPDLSLINAISTIARIKKQDIQELNTGTNRKGFRTLRLVLDLPSHASLIFYNTHTSINPNNQEIQRLKADVINLIKARYRGSEENKQQLIQYFANCNSFISCKFTGLDKNQVTQIQQVLIRHFNCIAFVGAFNFVNSKGESVMTMAG